MRISGDILFKIIFTGNIILLMIASILIFFNIHHKHKTSDKLSCHTDLFQFRSKDGVKEFLRMDTDGKIFHRNKFVVVDKEFAEELGMTRSKDTDNYKRISLTSGQKFSITK